MELNNKEKYIKQVVESQEFKLDTLALWDAIEDRVPVEEQPNRRGFLMIFLPFLLGALAVMGIWMLTGETTLEILNKNDQNVKEQFVDSQVELQKTTDLDYSNSIEVKPIQQPDLESTSQNKSTQQKRKATQTASTLSDATTTISRIVKRGNQIVAPQYHQPMVIQSKSNPTLIGGQTNTNYQELTLTNNKKKQGLIASLDQVIGLIPVEKSLVNISQPYWTKQHEIFDDKLTAKWKIGFYAGSNFTKSSLSTSSTLINKEFSKEKNLPGFSVGIGLERNLKHNFYIKSIAGVTSQITRYENTEVIEAIGEVNGPSEIYDQGELGALTTNSSVSTRSNIDFDVRWHRIHTQAQVALLIGRQFAISKNIYLNLEAGANANLLQRNEGYYLTEDNVPYTLFDNNENNPFADQVRIDPVLGLGIDWLCGKNFSIGFYANGNVIPYSQMNSNLNYQIKNFQLNTQLVVKRNLSWKK